MLCDHLQDNAPYTSHHTNYPACDEDTTNRSFHPLWFLLPLNNSPFCQTRTAGRILAAPLTRWAGGGGLCGISAAVTRSYTLQIMYYGSKSLNHSIYRIIFGPFCYRNHVIKLVLGQITQFTVSCGSFSLPIFLFLLDKVSKYHVVGCHQGAEHLTQVIIVRGTTALNVFQIFLHPIKNYNNVVTAFLKSRLINFILQILNTNLGGGINILKDQTQHYCT